MTYSLKTRDLAEAVRRVKLASVETMKRFDDHRRKVVAEKAAEVRAVVSDSIDPFLAAGEAMAANDDTDERAELVAYSTLANSQLSLFAELHRSIRLEDDEDARFNGFKAVRPGPGSDMWLLAADEKRLSGKRTHATEYALAESKARALVTGAAMRSKLARGQYDGVAVYAEDCLAAAGITLDKASRAWRSLLRRVQVAEVQVMEDIEARNEGKEPEYRGSDEILAEIAASLVPKPAEPSPTVSAISPHPAPAAPVSAAPKLSEVRDQWIAEGKAKEWSPKTAENRITLVDRFIALAGDRPIDGYTKADAQHFKEVLSSLPASWWQIEGLRDLSIEEASKKAKATGMQPMSITNVNKHIGCLYSLMSYAAKHYDEVDRNPFDGMRVEKKASARDERDSFTLDDALLRGRLRELATERRRFGCRRLHVLLRQEGYVVNHKRTQRLYREEGLSVRRRCCRKRAIGTRAPMVVEARPNVRWSLDFVHDQMASGQRFRVLNVIDDVTRQCLTAIPDTSISGKRVARELTTLIARFGRPKLIVSDNGTEFTSNAILLWAKQVGVEWHYIAPGRPMRDTASARHSTAGCGTNSSTRPCSGTSTTPARRSPVGSWTTTITAHIPPWAT